MKGKQNVHGNISYSAVRKHAFKVCTGGGEDFLGKYVWEVPCAESPLQDS